MRLGHLAPGQDSMTRPERVAALAPDRLAPARGEGRQEIVEAGVAVVEPMELLVVAVEQPVLAERLPSALGRKVRWIDEAPSSRGAPASGDERRPRGAAVGLWRNRSRGPVTGVNGTETWSFG